MEKASTAMVVKRFIKNQLPLLICLSAEEKRIVFIQ
jgi:hypothetical protein